MRRPLTVLLAATLLLIAGCSSLKVQQDWRENAAFGQYHSFKIIEPAETSAIADPLIRQRIEAAIRQGLIDRGFTESASDPDFWVAFHIRVQDKTSVSSYGYGYGYHPYGPYGSWGMWHAGPAYVDVHQYQEGALIVDFVDADDEEAFWRGWATDTVKGQGRDPAFIKMVVDKILSQYPPR